MSVKDSLTKIVTNSKEFSYSKKDVNLKFSIRVDNSSQLRPFRECLEEAIKDIDSILEGMKN